MSGRWRIVLPAITLIIGLVLTGVLAFVSRHQYLNDEQRLLKLRVRDAGALLTSSVPSTQTALASAAELADATNGDVTKFKRFIAPYVGTASGSLFVSVSLWQAADPGAGPVAVDGLQPKLASLVSKAPVYFARAAHSASFSAVGLLSPPQPRLGYAFVAESTRRYVAYGEKPLPPDRHSRYQNSSAFSGLDYALYLGNDVAPSNLLVSDLKVLPLHGTTARVTLPFGDTALTLVMVPRGSLSGQLFEDLPWIIGIVGLLLTLAAAVVVSRLLEGRRDAEQLASELEVTAAENQRLYSEQHVIAQTLQQALLPDVLPQIPGVEARARYHAGERGVEVGGDWYDVIDLDERRLLMVVGDVSGRGLKAAATMASLRFAIRAYAAQRDSPAEILTKVSGLLDVTDQGQLATILCAHVDIARRELTVTSAGHPPPLLIMNGESRFVTSEVGVPIGVQAGTSYASTTISVPGEATLIGFTDGLVEHRGESLDHGLERLRLAATGDRTGLPELLRRLVHELRDGPSEDDVAIVGLRWTS